MPFFEEDAAFRVRLDNGTVVCSKSVFAVFPEVSSATKWQTSSSSTCQVGRVFYFRTLDFAPGKKYVSSTREKLFRYPGSRRRINSMKTMVGLTDEGKDATKCAVMKWIRSGTHCFAHYCFFNLAERSFRF